MHRRSFRTLAISIVACAVPLFAAPAQAAEEPTVALVMKSLANEFFLTMENGATAYQKEHAKEFKLIANGIKNETDTAAQVAMVEQMIASKVNAIVLAPADSKALVPVVMRAVDAGIIVVNIDNKLDDAALKEKGLVVPFVGPDNRKGARLVGDYVGKQLKAGDEVAIIEGVSTTFNAQQRTLGFQDAMKAIGAKVVTVQSGDWEMAKANTVAAAVLSRYPDLKAILCGNDDMALGVVAAIKSANRGSQIKVGSYDDISAIRPLLANGQVLATIDQHAAEQAVFGIQTALKAISEHKKQNELTGVVETPVDLITKDTKPQAKAKAS